MTLLTSVRSARPAGAAALFLSIACGDDPQGPGEVPPPQIEIVLDLTNELESPGPAGSVPVAAGLFISGIAHTVAVDRARRLVAETNEILKQCNLHLVVEAAQVIGVPPDLRTVQGNEVGSWGGHSPDSLGDPDLVAYHDDERLTKDTRYLFGYGKRHTSPNAIGIFVVKDIEYYIGSERTGAAGLSFPPVIYHHPADYPLRNSVLATSTSGSVIAHELGHMLINTGDHWGEGFNLMLGGTELTSDQCDRIHEIRERLFGVDAVPDPGPPATGSAIALVSGNDQVGKAGEFLGAPFAVRVTNAQGAAARHVHVSWRVSSGAGRFVERPASRTDPEGVAKNLFLPTAVGASTVTAEVVGLEGPPVTFSIDAPVAVIRLWRTVDPWLGWFGGDPVFSGPEGGNDVIVPVGTTVEWAVIVKDSAHIVSTVEPVAGQAFDSGILDAGGRFQFVPGVAGTWRFQDRVSGATGILTARLTSMGHASGGSSNAGW